MRRKQKPKEDTSPTPKAGVTPKPLEKIVVLVTLGIALWGASLSTWVYLEQRRSITPRIYVRMDVEAAGYDASNTPVGDVQVLFSNVGEKTFSIAPRVGILAVDSRSGKMVETEACFERTKPQQARPYKSMLPATLKPGEEALAKSVTLSLLELVDPLDYYAVKFELSNGARYIVKFVDSDYLKRDRKSNRLAGWSAGGLASRIK